MILHRCHNFLEESDFVVVDMIYFWKYAVFTLVRIAILHSFTDLLTRSYKDDENKIKYKEIVLELPFALQKLVIRG